MTWLSKPTHGPPCVTLSVNKALFTSPLMRLMPVHDTYILKAVISVVAHKVDRCDRNNFFRTHSTLLTPSLSIVIVSLQFILCSRVPPEGEVVSFSPQGHPQGGLLFRELRAPPRRFVS